MSYSIAIEQGMEAGRYFYLTPTRFNSRIKGWHVSFAKRADFSGPVCEGGLDYCLYNGLSAVGWIPKPITPPQNFTRPEAGYFRNDGIWDYGTWGIPPKGWGDGCLDLTSYEGACVRSCYSCGSFGLPVTVQCYSPQFMLVCIDNKEAALIPREDLYKYTISSNLSGINNAVKIGNCYYRLRHDGVGASEKTCYYNFTSKDIEQICAPNIIVKNQEYRLITKEDKNKYFEHNLIFNGNCIYAPRIINKPIVRGTFDKTTYFNDEKQILTYNANLFRSDEMPILNIEQSSGFLGFNKIISYVGISGSTRVEPIVKNKNTAEEIMRESWYKKIWYIEEEKIDGFKLNFIDSTFTQKPFVKDMVAESNGDNDQSGDRTRHNYLLKGVVNPNNLSTAAFFQYSTGELSYTGRETQYTSFINIPYKDNQVLLTANITGLLSNQKYYSRIAAFNSKGNSETTSFEFTTPSLRLREECDININNFSLKVCTCNTLPSPAPIGNYVFIEIPPNSVVNRCQYFEYQLYISRYVTDWDYNKNLEIHQKCVEPFNWEGVQIRKLNNALTKQGCVSYSSYIFWERVIPPAHLTASKSYSCLYVRIRRYCGAGIYSNWSQVKHIKMTSAFVGGGGDNILSPCPAGTAGWPHGNCSF